MRVWAIGCLCDRGDAVVVAAEVGGVGVAVFEETDFGEIVRFDGVVDFGFDFGFGFGFGNGGEVGAGLWCGRGCDWGRAVGVAVVVTVVGACAR